MTGQATASAPAPYTDKPVCWGNVGVTSVDVFAPGLRINSTARSLTGGPAYSYTQGTSMAAPLVAATAALVEARDPITHGPEQLRNVLEEGVDAHPDLQPFAAWSGRLSAARSLQVGGRYKGSAGGWTSCDRDHDGWLDSVDNCPDTANSSQADDDEDRVGNECDSTPRGPDSDGDGKGLMDDRCPEVRAFTADGCPPPPPPTPTPTVSPTPTPVPGSPSPTPAATPTPALKIFLKVNVTKARAAKVRISVSRKAKVTLKIERRSGRKWKRVSATKSVTASMSVKSYTLRPTGRKKLTKGSYRLTATAGRVSEIAAFKVK
jgi:hypothetical protein